MIAKRQEATTTQDGTIIVYVTASPTFTGVIGGYTTLTDEGSTEVAATSSSGGQTLAPPAVASSASSAQTFVASTSQSSAAFSSVAASSAVAFTSAPSSFLTSATQSSSFNGAASNTAVDGAASTSGSSSPSSSSSSGGMSAGAKAGLAIGILAIIGLVAALLLWFLGKKRREKEEESRANDEKTTFGASQTAVPLTRNPTSKTAPRLSLRPMSRMMDGFMGNGNRRSGGNLLNTISEGGAAAGAGRGMSPSPNHRAVSPFHQEKPRHENPFADPQNPFEDPAPAPVRGPPPAAVRPPPTSAAMPPAQQSPQPRTKFNPSTAPPSQPRAMNLDAPSPAPTLPSSSPIAPLALGGAAGLAVAGAAAAAVASKSPPPGRSPSLEQALPIQIPTSPERTREEAASPNPDLALMPPTVAAALPSPAPSGASDAPGGNVYRVLMDFVPSMDDELDLKTGQLVRMLHEYDDGWVSPPTPRSLSCTDIS